MEISTYIKLSDGPCLISESHTFPITAARGADGSMVSDKILNETGVDFLGEDITSHTLVGSLSNHKPCYFRLTDGQMENLLSKPCEDFNSHMSMIAKELILNLRSRNKHVVLTMPTLVELVYDPLTSTDAGPVISKLLASIITMANKNWYHHRLISEKQLLAVSYDNKKTWYVMPPIGLTGWSTPAWATPALTVCLLQEYNPDICVVDVVKSLFPSVRMVEAPDFDKRIAGCVPTVMVTGSQASDGTRHSMKPNVALAVNEYIPYSRGYIMVRNPDSLTYADGTALGCVAGVSYLGDKRCKRTNPKFYCMFPASCDYKYVGEITGDLLVFSYGTTKFMYKEPVELPSSLSTGQMLYLLRDEVKKVKLISGWYYQCEFIHEVQARWDYRRAEKALSFKKLSTNAVPGVDSKGVKNWSWDSNMVPVKKGFDYLGTYYLRDPLSHSDVTNGSNNVLVLPYPTSVQEVPLFSDSLSIDSHSYGVPGADSVILREDMNLEKNDITDLNYTMSSQMTDLAKVSGIVHPDDIAWVLGSVHCNTHTITDETIVSIEDDVTCVECGAYIAQLKDLAAVGFAIFIRKEKRWKLDFKKNTFYCKCGRKLGTALSDTDKVYSFYPSTITMPTLKQQMSLLQLVLLLQSEFKDSVNVEVPLEQIIIQGSAESVQQDIEQLILERGNSDKQTRLGRELLTQTTNVLSNDQTFNKEGFYKSNNKRTYRYMRADYLDYVKAKRILKNADLSSRLTDDGSRTVTQLGSIITVTMTKRDVLNKITGDKVHWFIEGFKKNRHDKEYMNFLKREGKKRFYYVDINSVTELTLLPDDFTDPVTGENLALSMPDYTPLPSKLTVDGIARIM